MASIIIRYPHFHEFVFIVQNEPISLDYLTFLQLDRDGDDSPRLKSPLQRLRNW